MRLETSWKRTRDASFCRVPRSSSRPPQPSVFHWRPWTLNNGYGATRDGGAHLGSQHSEAQERKEDHKSKVNMGYIVSPCPKEGGRGRQQPPGSWIKIKIGGELLESWGTSKSDEETSKAGGLSRGYRKRGCGPQNDSPPNSSPESISSSLKQIKARRSVTFHSALQ